MWEFFFGCYIYKVKEQGNKYWVPILEVPLRVLCHVSRLNFVIFEVFYLRTTFLRICLFLEKVFIKARECLENK